MQIKQNNPRVEAAFQKLIRARKIADSAHRLVELAETELLDEMEQQKTKTVSTTQDGHVFSATYTQRSSTQLNEPGLRRALTARVFDKYTVRKLDRKALEQAMTAGEVDPVVVAQFAEQVPGKTFLTYRVKEERNEADSS